MIQAEFGNGLGMVFSRDSALGCAVWQRGAVTSQRSVSQSITAFRANRGVRGEGKGRLSALMVCFVSEGNCSR